MRRTYYIRIEVRPASVSVAKELLAAKSVRSRLGIFQVNKWREIAEAEAGKMGFSLGPQFGRATIDEWPLTAFIYGTFDKDGSGRSASNLMRIPAKENEKQNRQ